VDDAFNFNGRIDVNGRIDATVETKSITNVCFVARISRVFGIPLGSADVE
jgi:hypothetical protein